MNSQTKRQLRGRILTLISKLDELKQPGYEDSEIWDALPSSIEGVEQELVGSYTDIQ